MKKNELDLKKYYLVIYRGNRFLAHIDPTKWPLKGTKIPLIIDKAEKPFSGPLMAPMPCFYDVAPEAERYAYFAEWVKSSPTPKDTSASSKRYVQKKRAEKKGKAQAAPIFAPAPAAAPAPAPAKPAPANDAAVIAFMYHARQQLHAYADLLEFSMKDALSQGRKLDLSPLINNIAGIQNSFNAIVSK